MTPRKPSDVELLRSVYRCLDVDRLLSNHPSLTSDDVKRFFRRLAATLPVGEKPAPRRGRAKRVVLYTDGGSRGNPGPAGYGIVLLDTVGKTILERSGFITRATSNQAEYRGLIAGLEAVMELGASGVIIRCDSELLVRQLSGRYRVKSQRLRPLFLRAKELLAGLPSWRVEHIPREANQRADALANKAMDRHKPR